MSARMKTSEMRLKFDGNENGSEPKMKEGMKTSENGNGSRNESE